jgi:hypothetical protein
MRKFDTKGELVKWLKTLGKCTILSFSLMGAGASLNANLQTTPLAIEYAVNHQNVDIGNAPYFVRAEIAQDEEDGDNLSFENKIIAFWADVQFVRTGEPCGGYPELLSELSGFEYICNIKFQQSPRTGTFIINMPDNPAELQTLKSIVSKHSLYWAFDDRSGFFTLANTFPGRGAYPPKWR